MNDAADLLELLEPAVAGRIEALAELPVRTIGDQLDDRTATVSTLTVVLAQLDGVTLEQAASRYPTVLGLRRAVDAAVLTVAQRTLDAARAAQEPNSSDQQDEGAGGNGEG